MEKSFIFVPRLTDKALRPHSSTDSPDSYRGKFPASTFLMYYVYIIQSKVDQSFYIGRTSDLSQRLMYHNSPDLNKGVTQRKIPWSYFYVLQVSSSTAAGRIERHIKKMKSTRYIRSLVKYPEIGEKLIKKYS